MISRIGVIIRKILALLKILSLKVFYGNQIELKKGCSIDIKTKILIHNQGLLSIGLGSILRSNSMGYHAGMPFNCTILIDVSGASIKIGDNVRINGAYIHSQKEIQIGSNCVIASGVNILDSNGHVVNSLNRTIGRDNPESISIGSNVWIGLNSIILKGTIIGDNSIIGAGSVVQGVFPSNVIIKGNPGVIIRSINYE